MAQVGTRIPTDLPLDQQALDLCQLRLQISYTMQVHQPISHTNAMMRVTALPLKTLALLRACPPPSALYCAAPIPRQLGSKVSIGIDRSGTLPCYTRVQATSIAAYTSMSDITYL